MSSWIKRTALAAVATAALMGAASAEVVYNRANSGEPETLDTHKTSTVQEAHILRDMLEGLVTYNAKGEAVPGQAEKWEIGDDGKTYRFTLRNGAEMVERRSGEGLRLRLFLSPHHGSGDGREIRQHPLSRSRMPRRSTRARASPRNSASRPSTTKTLEITLEQPTPYFIELLTHQTSLPGAPGLGREVRQGLREAGQHGDERRLQARRVRAELPHQARQERELLRREERPDRHGQLLPDPGLRRHGPPLRGRRARHHRRRAGRPDEVAQGALQGSGRARAVSRHLVPRRELLQGPLQRRAACARPSPWWSTASSSRSRSGARPCSRAIRSCLRASAITAIRPT